MRALLTSLAPPRLAQGAGTDDDGLYSANALTEEARKKKEEKDRLCKIENLAKLPTDMWADTFKDIAPEQMQKMVSRRGGCSA